ncbi:hypothetical protein RHGRI_028706 [Rhododendron griersonianum]|uniref:Uncharacterized protein n=1 Tax=Rhododendron griersonianum TaxID=479676 RepID=A0AAV6IGR1_9ERIC|nr:hypothetical protein RHGRI_028706 [Rhododendron griersonianum]
MAEGEFKESSEISSSAEKNTEHPKVTSSSYGQRNTVSNAKFEVEKFDGTSNFGMWQCEVLDVLYQQELNITNDHKDKNERFKHDTNASAQVPLSLSFLELRSFSDFFSTILDVTEPRRIKELRFWIGDEAQATNFRDIVRRPRCRLHGYGARVNYVI